MTLSSQQPARPKPRQPQSLAARLRHFLVPILLVALAILALAALPHPAAAQSNGGAILIWPVGPVIEADERAAALWLENPGKGPITLQIRIYAWAQEGGKNGYAPQDTILGTPPIVTIAPGEKQLVRLTRTNVAPPATESAYRVVVDEIPAAKTAEGSGAAVSFRMRYSIPLFTYGESLASPAALSRAKTARKGASPAGPIAGPQLDWRIAETNEGRFLEIRNRGAIHARLTDVEFGTGPAEAAKGLFGYVLPGATMRWPIEADKAGPTFLTAAINGAPPAPVERRTD